MGQGRTRKTEMNAVATNNNTVHTEHYRTEYLRAKQMMARGADAELVRLKDSAMNFFLANGFPSTKDEEWRFTNLQPLLKNNFSMPAQEPPPGYTDALNKYAIGIPGARIILFVNGRFVQNQNPEFSGSGNISLRSFSQAIMENDPVLKRFSMDAAARPMTAITALNTGMFNDGIIIEIPDGMKLTHPVHLIFLTLPENKNLATYPRNLIITGANSSVMIVEHYISDARTVHFTNSLTEISVGVGALVEHIKLQMESQDAYHISTLYARQKAGSKLNQHSVMIGGSITRNEIISVLDDENTECTLTGLSLAAGKQLIDNHTAIDHARPNCASHELYKAILDGSSKGVFNGKIFVRKDAQKTDAKQTNKTLLLSDNAVMNTKPQLEIFADDVKCTHGAAIGYLDAEAIFYLRSRGISEEIARDLLTYAFANDVLSKIPIESIREHLSHLVYTRLKQGRKLETMQRNG